VHVCSCFKRLVGVLHQRLSAASQFNQPTDQLSGYFYFSLPVKRGLMKATMRATNQPANISFWVCLIMIGCALAEGISFFFVVL